MLLGEPEHRRQDRELPVNRAVRGARLLFLDGLALGDAFTHERAADRDGPPATEEPVEVGESLLGFLEVPATGRRVVPAKVPGELVVGSRAAERPEFGQRGIDLPPDL